MALLKMPKYLPTKLLFCLICLASFTYAEDLAAEATNNDLDLLIVATVTNSKSDLCEMSLRRTKRHNINIKMVDFPPPDTDQQRWKAKYDTSRRLKIKSVIQEIKHNPNKVILLIDCDSSLVLRNASDILQTFLLASAKILFSGGIRCKKKHVFTGAGDGYPCLDSKAIIGYAPALYSLLDAGNADEELKDNVFYSKLLLEDRRDLMEKLNVAIDTTAVLLQTLPSTGYVRVGVSAKKTAFKSVPVNTHALYLPKGDTSMRMYDDDWDLLNHVYNTSPFVISGEGEEYMRHLNYLADTWTLKRGCVLCAQDGIRLKPKQEDTWPKVMVSVFITEPVPFILKFFTKLKNLDYPKKRIDVMIYSAAQYHEKHVNEYIKETGHEYNSIGSSNMQSEAEARGQAMNECVKLKCDFYFNVDATVHLDRNDSLKLLIKLNRTVVAPALASTNNATANFYTLLMHDGGLGRMLEWTEYINGQKRGLWMVPFVSSCYLINASILHSESLRPNYMIPGFAPNISFAFSLESKGFISFLYNEYKLGHLVNPIHMNTSVMYPELFESMANEEDWETEYLHVNYSDTVDLTFGKNQICPDVYLFPLVSPKFCQEILNMTKASEESGFDGSSSTARILSLDSMGFNRDYVHIIERYIGPIQRRVWPTFIGANVTSLVLSYGKDEEQDEPHEDESKYSLNLALNEDFEGGGTYFNSYKSTVHSPGRTGWVSMYPGGFTHYHKELPVTDGLRFSLISLIHNNTMNVKYFGKKMEIAELYE